MNDILSDVNMQPTSAPLKNIGLTSQLLEQAINRPPHLPGIVVLYGPSGYGKSFAAAFAANAHDAYYIECKSVWTTKNLAQNILREMRIVPEGNVADMIALASEQLALSGRPLIIDEVDHIVQKKNIEVIRDIYESSLAPILLIGEESLGIKLNKWERFHNRVLRWQQAQPSDLADAMLLARMYCPSVTIERDLLARIVEKTLGVTRRICVNIDSVRVVADSEGWDSVSMALWGKRDIYTGEPTIRERKSK